MDILIVDDDRLTLHALQFNLESLGHQVYSADTSEEAINLVARGIKGLKFDLLISDIMMPGISGLSLVTLLRSIHLCTIPIIVMSTLKNEYLYESVLKLGATDFISKPIATEELADKLKKFDKNTSVLT